MDIIKLESPERESFIFSLGIVFLLFGVLAGPVAFWDVDHRHISGRLFVGAGALLLLLSLALAKFKVHLLSFAPSTFAIGLLLVFGSDWLCRGYNLFQGPSIRGELILGAIFTWVALKYRATPQAVLILAAVVPLLLMWCFIKESDGRLLFSDDHASFIYRLQLLKENFPRIPFFNPLWNGGVDARDFFATGALNVFFLLSPLIYLFELREIYNVVVLLLLFVVVPGSVFFAARYEKIAMPGCAIASILALSCSLGWYRWALKYGTLGFITSAALVPLILAFVTSVLSKEESISWGAALLLVVCGTLMLLWTPAGLIFLPVIFLGISSFKRVILKPLVAPIVLALFLLNLPWVLVFWSVSDVSKFITAEQPSYSEMHASADSSTTAATPAPVVKGRKGGISIQKSLKVLRETLLSSNPLTIFFSLPGIFLLKRSRRLVWCLSTAWLFLLGAFISPLKPQLELERMLLVLLLCLAIPAGAALQRLFMEATFPINSRMLGLVKTGGVLLAGGFLLVGPLATGAILRNRTVEQYHFSKEIVSAISNAIVSHGGDGRVLFSGFILHELSEGHVAPLVNFTKRPLMASSPMHSYWRYVDVIPESFLAKEDQGVEEYLDLYNVSAVIAHEKHWTRYFAKHPERFELMWEMERFSLYKRKSSPGTYFLSGLGEVLEQNSHAVKLRLQSEEAVVRYNYFPFLMAAGCKVSPFSAAPDVQLTKLSGCPIGEIITLQSKTVFERVLKG